MQRPDGMLGELHCSRCGLNYRSKYYSKDSTCPGCGGHGFRDACIGPYDQRRDGAMSGMIERG